MPQDVQRIPPFPRRRTSELRKGRISIPQVRYFLTLRSALEMRLFPGPSACVVMRVLEEMRETGDWIIESGVVMPDHVHLLTRLGERLSLDRCVAKFKALTRRSGCRWQANYYEHRLRDEESSEGFALYIFLNPYRAVLLDRHEVWPFRVRGDGVAFDFDLLLEEGRSPPAEWLTDPWCQLGVQENLIRE